MNSYILSILGIVVAGVVIDIIIPSGSINKYIKSVYSIFVVAVIMMPIINLINNKDNFQLNYTDFQIQEDLGKYIFEKKTIALEEDIEQYFANEGFKNIDINLFYSVKNNNFRYNSCAINLVNLAINADKQHINKYEFIFNVVNNYTNLTKEEIIINEW